MEDVCETYKGYDGCDLRLAQRRGRDKRPHGGAGTRLYGREVVWRWVESIYVKTWGFWTRVFRIYRGTWRRWTWDGRTRMT